MKPSMLHRAALAFLLSTSLACDYFASIEAPEVDASSSMGRGDAGGDALVDEDTGKAVVLVDASGTTVTEAGGEVTLSFSLSQQPSTLVLITATLSSEDRAEVELIPESLTFTPDQWQQDKTIVVRGIDDLEADGKALVVVSFEPIVSDDPAYSGLELDPVELINEDGVCGNDVIDGDEDCEPPDPSGCAQATGECTLCNATCKEEVVDGGPSCGDGIVNQPSEQCDAPGQPALCPNGRAVVTCQDRCVLPTQGCEPRVDVTQHGGCYIEDDTTVTCWGLDLRGVASPPLGLTDYTSVVVDGASACGLRGSGQLNCWGAASTLPVDGLAEVDFVQIDVSDDPAHLCGVDVFGITRCIGDDREGQASPPDIGFARVEVSGQGSCGLTSDGEIECWGVGADDAPAGDPNQRFVFVSGNGGNWCALTTQGKIVCWGPDVDNDLFAQDGFIDLDFGERSVCGVLGLSSQEEGVACVDFDAPAWAPASMTPTFGALPSLAVGNRSICFIDDGELACTQSDVHLGHAGVDLIALEAHKGCVCAVNDRNKLRCSGEPEFCPADQLSMLFAKDIALKADGGCVIEQGSNDISCWQVSQNGTPTSLIPINIVGTPEVVEVDGAQGCALDTQDKVTCWVGRNVQPGPSESFLAVSLGTNFACGVRDSTGGGIIECWSFIGSFVPLVPSTRDIRDIEVVGTSGCFRDATSRLGCFGSLNPDYMSPSTPGELLSAGKSLCFIENQTDAPWCFSASGRLDTRFDGMPLELFVHTDTTSYAVPRDGALVWRTN